MIHRYFHRPGIRRAALTASIAGNLLLLGTFRYSGFIVRSLNAAFGWALPAPAFSPPAAICFYTLQSISYILDLSRGDAEVQKNYLSYLAGISMFPRLTAGPVVRWGKMSQELECRRISLPQIGEGAFQLVIGLGKKVLIADNIGLLWQQVEAASGDLLPAVTAWLGILAFTFQIYFAFSGYSDMACGIGRMLGFSFPQNFNFPYMAQSVTDFWQRWHISNNWLPVLFGRAEKRWPVVKGLRLLWMLLVFAASLAFLVNSPSSLDVFSSF